MGSISSPFDLQTCVRPNILKLKPYRCARDDYKDNGKNILLDANENAYGPGLALTSEGGVKNVSEENKGPQLDLLGLNRYPDPHQMQLKKGLCRLRNTKTHTQRDLRPENLFVGVGSDEAIDALFRCFCRPGTDKILTCPPTYGMYGVSAQVNDIQVVHVPLDVENGFGLQTDKISEALSSDATIKMVYVCSPGNPTGQLIRKADVQRLLQHPSWNGVVVLDEAYIDFAADGSSLAEWVTEWPNLVVTNTLSKAFGLAGIRLGAAFCSPEIATLLNSLKAPYNISSPTSALAIAALEVDHLAVMHENRTKILKQRDRLARELPKISGIGRLLGGTDSNFLLFEVLDRPEESGGRADNAAALVVYETMAEQKGVVVRFRGTEYGCEGCLRITVGTESEVDRFLVNITNVLQDLHRGDTTHRDQREEERAERRANEVVS